MPKYFAPKPCKHCPWKRSSKVGGGDIPNFSLSLMRNLASTAKGGAVHDRDQFRKIFACHDSKEGSECACAGYVARDGLHNLNVRLLAIQNDVDLTSIIREAEKHELYDSFEEMLSDYEAANY
ncbi:hypothetical protein GTG28_20625 [Vibrio sp. OCN044]|uniref:Uncharacterized protein n=1 Tax=Vibrio tetraodonis subsp. pristinus TaxID=2695891 RepID=A0A6L8M5J6_9VIBR|nr:DUF6283 family protein [Vibrio tetraodonis]MYM61609.1 hypothetical protein [Vibrio tetraodonis subsp. pristinus]